MFSATASGGGGFGSAILEWYAEHDIYHMQIKPIGIPDYYVEHGSIPEQRQEVGLTVDKLMKQVKAMLLLHKQIAQ
jgi:1-deoxy-D-xylulose-5-phosphate synthase